MTTVFQQSNTFARAEAQLGYLGAASGFHPSNRGRVTQSPSSQGRVVDSEIGRDGNDLLGMWGWTGRDAPTIRD